MYNKQDNEARRARVWEAQKTLALLLGAREPPAMRTCPVCGAPLTDGDRVYTAPDGTPLGCEACVEMHFV